MKALVCYKLQRACRLLSPDPLIIKEISLDPIIKWTGGKRWLVPTLKEIWEPFQNYRLVEPFVGGMAITLGLNPKNALLNDANIHLINFYEQIKKGFEIKLALKNNETFYYQLRSEFNALIRQSTVNSKKAATMFYYLIRTGFNGLCRFNSQGEFNVPFGQHKSIRYKKDFAEYTSILKKWDFVRGDFETLKLKKTDFLYVDPPYDVEFTQYQGEGFTWEDQVRLAHWLCKHDGPLVVSNQATDRILELYRDLKFKIKTVSAPRFIACNGDRTPALEMLALKQS